MPEVVVVSVQPSARLALQASSPDYTTAQADLPEGLVALPGWPRVGDQIEWPHGTCWTVEQFTWFTVNRGGDAKPGAVDGFAPPQVVLGHGPAR